MMIQEEAEENMVDAQYTIEQTRLELQVLQYIAFLEVCSNDSINDHCCVQAERERSQSLTGQLEKTTSRLKDLEMANSVRHFAAITHTLRAAATIAPQGTIKLMWVAVFHKRKGQNQNVRPTSDPQDK